jgi:hypothetical protein
VGLLEAHTKPACRSGVDIPTARGLVAGSPPAAGTPAFFVGITEERKTASFGSRFFRSKIFFLNNLTFQKAVLPLSCSLN